MHGNGYGNFSVLCILLIDPVATCLAGKCETVFFKRLAEVFAAHGREFRHLR